MDTTILLARVLGLYLVIIGVVVLLRRRYFLPVFATYPEQRLVRAVVSLAEVLGGLFLVVAPNRWSPLPAVLITVTGWLILLEGLLYLVLPDQLVRRLIGAFNTEGWYIAGGVATIAAGAYLAAFGFGWIAPLAL
jgi:uncharacterized protein YjeT (DUF2065 family)